LSLGGKEARVAANMLSQQPTMSRPTTRWMDGIVYLILADKSPARAFVLFFYYVHTHPEQAAEVSQRKIDAPHRESLSKLKETRAGSSRLFCSLNLLPAHTRSGRAHRICVSPSEEYTPSCCRLLAIDFPALWEIGSKSCSAHKEKMTHLTALERRTRRKSLFIAA
jgi:hypothetical protein